MNFRNKYMTLVFATLAAVSLAAASATQAAEVRASLSSHEAYVGMPITVYVEIANAHDQQEPNLPSIDGVEIKSSGAASRSSQTTIINGRRSERSSVTYAWQVTPRRAGEFVVPPIDVRVDGQVMTTRVMRFVANQSETGNLMFVEVAGQQQKIYVGQPLDVTLRIWLKPFHDKRYDVTLSDGDMWQLLDQEQSNWGPFADRMIEMAQNRQRASGERVLRKDSEGVERQYDRYDIDATIYPKRPGKVDTGGLQVVANYPTGLERSRSFFSMSDLAISGVRPIVADAEVAPIEVMPVPTAGRPADYRGTVGQYEIVTQATPTSVKAGDPITLHIGIRGDGPMDLVQAPPLADMPELTTSFRVPDEALAGRVKDNVKVFTVSIRPRRAGIAEIPAIGLTYFDPHAEEFVTVHSEPIAIQVAEADHLALSSIVGTASGTRGDENVEASQADVISLTNYAGHDVLESAAPNRIWTWILWLLVAPAAYIVALSVKQRDSIRARLSGTRAAAKRRARLALAAASTPHEVATAVFEYIASLLDLPKTSLTRSEAVRQLNMQTSNEVVEQIDRLLAACEVSCYAASMSADVELLKTEADACIDLLAVSIRRKQKSATKKPLNLIGRKTSKAALSAGCVLFAAMLVSSTMAQAGELSTEQAVQILTEAGDAYATAQAATEPADAKAAVALAAQKYQTLVDSGVDNGKLYFNLGNAYLQLGDTPRALANYRRASELLPSDDLVRQNMIHAETLLGIAPAAQQGFWETLKAWFHNVSPRSLLVGGFIAWALLWTGMIGALFVKLRTWRRIAIPAALCFVVCTALIGYQTSQQPTHDRAMVVAEATLPRTGNGDAFAATTDQPLTVGSTCELVEQRDHWLRIRLADGQTAWVAADHVEVLPARRT